MKNKFKTLLISRFNGSIQSRIIIMGAIAMLITAGIIIGYASTALYSEAFGLAESNVNSKAILFAGDISNELTGPLSISKTLANTVTGMYQSGKPPTREQIINTLKENLRQNDEIFAIYLAFEPNAFDNNDTANKNTKGSDETGRFLPYWFRSGSTIKLEALRNMEKSDYLKLSKKSLKSSVTEPYLYNAGGTEVNMMSLTTPIIVNDKYIGIAGVDVDLSDLNAHAKSFEMYNGEGVLLILTKNGMIIGDNQKNKDWTGQNVHDVPVESIGFAPEKIDSDIEKVQKGASLLYTSEGYTKAVVPAKIGDSGVYWDVSVSVPENVISQSPMEQVRNLIIIGIILTILGVVMLFFVAREIARPVTKIALLAEKFANGEITTDINTDQGGEIGRLTNSFKRLGESLKIKEEISMLIANGDFNTGDPVTSNKDNLGLAMVKMKNSIEMVVNSVHKIGTAAENGILNIRISSAGFNGEYQQIILKLNNTLDSITNPLVESMRLADSYAKGDFTDKMDESLQVKGEFIKFRDALNIIGINSGSAMGHIKNEIENLTAGMEETDASAVEVSNSASTLAESSTSVSSLAKRSEYGMNQTLTAMEDLSLSVNSVATKAEEISTLAQQASNLSEQGALLAGKAESGMQSIMNSVDETNIIIDDINNQMDEIGKIIDLITGIADETNLLALNAAIEAAQAGDAGKSFAVVADEVKSLALESQKSSENITKIIKNLQKKSHMVSMSMKTSKDEVDIGNKAVEETIIVFKQIVEAISHINTNMTEVAGSTEEQAASVEEVTANVHELESIIEDTARESVNSAAATEEVTASISQIQKAISDASASIQSIAIDLDKFKINR